MLKNGEERNKFINTIGNPSRLKILLALWKTNDELRIYKICRLTGLGRSAVQRHLNKLVQNKIVSKKMYGAVTLYTLNEKEVRMKSLTEFFKKAF